MPRQRKRRALNGPLAGFPGPPESTTPEGSHADRYSQSVDPGIQRRRRGHDRGRRGPGPVRRGPDLGPVARGGRVLHRPVRRPAAGARHSARGHHPGPAPGVLGFHTEDQGGKLWGVVAAKPELDNGAKVTTGDWSVSSVLSHEVLEMFV